MRALLVGIAMLILFLPAPVRAETPTERYAPAQLGVARHFLERARAHAALGEHAQAGRFASQAAFDARLTWGMSDSPHLRAEAAEVGRAANALVTRLAAPR
jgi:hypothetical protein